MNRQEKALQLFSDGCNCAQSVLAAFSAETGLGENISLKIATGLGAGIGYRGKTCGAAIGAYMVIGMLKGSQFPGDELGEEVCYALAVEFDRRFVSSHGSTECSRLLGINMADPRGYSEALERKLFDSKCPKYVKEAVTILENLFNINSK